MAYQRYQYETSPRKLQPEYEPIKNKPYKNKTTIKKQNLKQNEDKRQNQIKKQTVKKQTLKPKVRLALYISAVFIILFAISYQNSLITESFNKKESLKKNLSVLEKENEQLKVNIEQSLNLNNVEQSAKEMLGMQKLDNSKKVYISLPKKDYIEAATEEVTIEEDTNFIQKIIQYVKDLF